MNPADPNMNPADPYIAMAFVALIILLAYAYRREKSSLKIRAPRIGFLNLKGAPGEQALIEDKRSFASMFCNSLESSTVTPSCDVLFIYCDIAPDGKVSGPTTGLRSIIRDSGAQVVVVASENRTESYIAAAKKTGYGRANLVMTLERRGDVFPKFFNRLFAQVLKGTPLPVAWVNLAPQGPAHNHTDCPVTILILEKGRITFN